jgi:hypothetical protein
VLAIEQREHASVGAQVRQGGGALNAQLRGSWQLQVGSPARETRLTSPLRHRLSIGEPDFVGTGLRCSYIHIPYRFRIALCSHYIRCTFISSDKTTTMTYPIIIIYHRIRDECRLMPEAPGVVSTRVLSSIGRCGANTACFSLDSNSQETTHAPHHS